MDYCKPSRVVTPAWLLFQACILSASSSVWCTAIRLAETSTRSSLPSQQPWGHTFADLTQGNVTLYPSATV